MHSTTEGNGEVQCGGACAGGGLGDELRQPVFSLGMKGVKPEDAEKVRTLLTACSLYGPSVSLFRQTFRVGWPLRGLPVLSPVSIGGPLPSMQLLSKDTGTCRSRRLMLRAMAPWIYDKDPFQPLQWTKDLEHFKAGILDFAIQCLKVLTAISAKNAQV